MGAVIKKNPEKERFENINQLKQREKKKTLIRRAETLNPGLIWLSFIFLNPI